MAIKRKHALQRLTKTSLVSVANENLRYLQKAFRVSLKADLRLIISICEAYLVGSALAEGGIDGNQAQSCNPKINPNIFSHRG
ncbi:hypothetical protein [Marinomonas sp.]